MFTCMKKCVFQVRQVKFCPNNILLSSSYDKKSEKWYLLLVKHSSDNPEGAGLNPSHDMT